MGVLVHVEDPSCPENGSFLQRAVQPGESPVETERLKLNRVSNYLCVLKYSYFSFRRASLIVRAGVLSLTDPNPDNIFETTEWYMHPKYNEHNTKVQPNDISLIKLQRPVVYSSEYILIYYVINV